ncbi:MAG TPA: hypothetical protein VFE07_06585 [Marmoricola sp.]|jgi:hypothetical protein|nr:hypothetical protein [Marmoricola sp.]
MSKRLALVWGLGLCLLIVARFRFGDRTEAWLDASGAVVGLIGTPALLAFWADRQRAQNARDVAAGRYLWACRAREMRPHGGWGVNGRLTAAHDGTTNFKPSRSSIRRGAQDQTWPSGLARITHVARKRDITGIKYDVIDLDLPDGEVHRFGVFAAAGTVPASSA